MGTHRPRRQDSLGGFLSEANDNKRRRAFFGRRKGHPLRSHQAELFEALLPRLRIDLTKSAPKQPGALFSRAISLIRIEIGFGGGEHLLYEARSHPDHGFIGCEPFLNGMAKALARIDEEKLDNVRLHHGDAIELLDWLPSHTVDRIDILYPDPWPKKRHWKRRFVSDENVSRFARVLKPGGRLRFATDIESYVEWGLIRFLRSPDFDWPARRADDWRKAWVNFPGTRYEAKAFKEGRKPVYLEFRRT